MMSQKIQTNSNDMLLYLLQHKDGEKAYCCEMAYFSKRVIISDFKNQ